MAKVSVYNMEGKEVESIDLNDAVFGVEVNEHLVHMAVVQQLANNRQGTQKAKTRSEVSGGGRKPWRQKEQVMQDRVQQELHSGQEAAQFRSSTKRLLLQDEQEGKESSSQVCINSRVQENKLIVIDELKFDEIKTKNFKAVMDNLKVNKAYVVLNENDEKVVKSARNLPNVQTALTNTINVYDVMKGGTVILTKDAVKTIEEVYA